MSIDKYTKHMHKRNMNNLLLNWTSSLPYNIHNKDEQSQNNEGHKQNISPSLFLSAVFAQAMHTYNNPSRMSPVGPYGRSVGRHGYDNGDTNMGFMDQGGFDTYYNSRRFLVSL